MVRQRAISSKEKPAQLFATRAFLLFFLWWAHQDSNLGPSGYEPVALTN
jgi:hypothetical protein